MDCLTSISMIKSKILKTESILKSSRSQSSITKFSHDLDISLGNIIYIYFNTLISEKFRHIKLKIKILDLITIKKTTIKIKLFPELT